MGNDKAKDKSIVSKITNNVDMMNESARDAQLVARRVVGPQQRQQIEGAPESSEALRAREARGREESAVQKHVLDGVGGVVAEGACG